MLSKTFRGILAALVLMVFTTMSVNNAHAQLTRFQSNSLYPVEMTVGAGGGLNTNLASGTFNPDQTGAMGFRTGDYNVPEFHAMVEIPVTDNLMIVPRVTYNDFSNVLDNQEQSDITVPTSQTTAYRYRLVGGELLAKYRVFDGLHVLGGANVSGAVRSDANQGITKAYASTSESSSLPKTLVSAVGGLGYDIPINGTNRIWLSPEVVANVPLQNLAQTGTDGSLHSVTISSRVSMKFGLGSR